MQFKRFTKRASLSIIVVFSISACSSDSDELSEQRTYGEVPPSLCSEVASQFDFNIYTHEIEMHEENLGTEDSRICFFDSANHDDNGRLQIRTSTQDEDFSAEEIIAEVSNPRWLPDSEKRMQKEENTVNERGTLENWEDKHILSVYLGDQLDRTEGRSPEAAGFSVTGIDENALIEITMISSIDEIPEYESFLEYEDLLVEMADFALESL